VKICLDESQTITSSSYIRLSNRSPSSHSPTVKSQHGSGPKHSLIYPFSARHVPLYSMWTICCFYIYFYSYQDATVNIKYICLHIHITQTNSQISSQVSLMQSWKSCWHICTVCAHFLHTMIKRIIRMWLYPVNTDSHRKKNV